MSFQPLRTALVASTLVAASGVLPLTLAPSVAQASVPACTATFTGAASDLWSDAANWAGSTLPGTADVACLSGASVTIPPGSPTTVGAIEDGGLVVQAPVTLTLDSATSSLSSLSLGADLDGPGSSVLSIDGDVTVNATSAIQISPSGLGLLQSAGHTFSVVGDAPVDLAGGSLDTDSPISVFDTNLVATQATSWSTTSTVSFAAGTYRDAAGTLDLRATGALFAGSTTLGDVALEVSGTASSIAGTNSEITLGSASVDANGSFVVPSGDTVRTSSDDEIDGEISGPGTWDTSGDTLLNGTISVGVLDVMGATSTVSPDATYDPDTTQVSGGTLTFDANGDTGTVVLSTGQIDSGVASATLSVHGDVVWGPEGLLGSSDTNQLTLDQDPEHGFSIVGKGPATLEGASIDTSSPLIIDNPDFTTVESANGPAHVTASAITMGSNVVVKSNATDSAIFTTDALTSPTSTAGYGFESDGVILNAGPTRVSVATTLMTGPLLIAGGSLDIGGTLSSAGAGVEQTGGQLDGAGTLIGDLNQVGGTLAPGSPGSLGTFKVRGTYTLGSDATLLVTEASSTNVSKLTASGTAVLKGTIEIASGAVAVPSGVSFDAVGAGTLSADGVSVVPGDHFTGVAHATTFTITAEQPSTAPTDVVARAQGGEAAVTWAPPLSDGGGAITSFLATAIDLTTSSAGGQTCRYVTGGPYPDSCVVNDLTVGDRYSFVVTAENAVGTSPPSSPSLPVVPEGIPDAPTNVIVVAGDASAQVTWAAPVNDGYSDITFYEATAVDTSNPLNGAQTCAVLASKTSVNACTISGLVNSDTYEVVVSATNRIGQGPASAPSNSITPEPPPTVEVAPNRLVLPAVKTTHVECVATVGELTSCAISVVAPNGSLIASGSSTTVTPSVSLSVTVHVTHLGLVLATPVGGVSGRVVATMTNSPYGTQQATATLKLVVADQSTTLGDALFVDRSATWSSFGRRSVGALATSVKGASAAECDGYSDDVGTASSDRALALARARAVCAILRPDVGTITIVSYGSSDPVATNGTAAGRAANRRVVVKITN